MKATRISLGMQGCSATYSCSYCYGKAPFDEPAELRTFKSINEDYEAFKALVELYGPEEAYKHAKDCKNQIHKSLIEGDFEDQKLLFKILIDELHIFLGIGNKTFDSLYIAMVKDIDNDIFHASVYVWANKESIVGLNYRGGQLDSPNLNRLLHRLDSLEKFVDPKFHNYIYCMREFHAVQDACFGMILAPDWEEKIEVFKIAYKALGISITPKVHTLFYEIPIFIKKTGKALGHFSAHHFEAGHFDFEGTLQLFKRKESIVSAMYTYAGEHI